MQNYYRHCSGTRCDVAFLRLLQLQRRIRVYTRTLFFTTWCAITMISNVILKRALVRWLIRLRKRCIQGMEFWWSGSILMLILLVFFSSQTNCKTRDLHIHFRFVSLTKNSIAKMRILYVMLCTACNVLIFKYIFTLEWNRNRARTKLAEILKNYISGEVKKQVYFYKKRFKSFRDFSRISTSCVQVLVILGNPARIFKISFECGQIWFGTNLTIFEYFWQIIWAKRTFEYLWSIFDQNWPTSSTITGSCHF